MTAYEKVGSVSQIIRKGTWGEDGRTTMIRLPSLTSPAASTTAMTPAFAGTPCAVSRLTTCFSRPGPKLFDLFAWSAQAGQFENGLVSNV